MGPGRRRRKRGKGKKKGGEKERMSGTSHSSAEKHGPGTVLRVRFEVTPEPIFPSLTKPQERKTSWQMTGQLCPTEESSRNQRQAEEK